MNAFKFISWCQERHLGYGAAKVIAAIMRIKDEEETIYYWLIEDLTDLCRRNIHYIARDLEHRGLAILSRGSIRLTDATISQLKALS